MWGPLGGFGPGLGGRVSAVGGGRWWRVGNFLAEIAAEDDSHRGQLRPSDSGKFDVYRVISGQGGWPVVERTLCRTNGDGRARSSPYCTVDFVDFYTPPFLTCRLQRFSCTPLGKMTWHNYAQAKERGVVSVIMVLYCTRLLGTETQGNTEFWAYYTGHWRVAG